MVGFRCTLAKKSCLVQSWIKEFVVVADPCWSTVPSRGDAIQVEIYVGGIVKNDLSG